MDWPGVAERETNPILLLWAIAHREVEQAYGKIPDFQKKDEHLRYTDEGICSECRHGCHKGERDQQAGDQKLHHHSHKSSAKTHI